MHQTRFSLPVVIVGLGLAVIAAKVKPPPEPKEKLFSMAGQVECVDGDRVKLTAELGIRQKSAFLPDLFTTERVSDKLSVRNRSGDVWIEHILPAKNGFHVYLSDGVHTVMVSAPKCRD
ncbi:Uncharacterised protein [Candidatus Bilamarchaeum dharawalense]|uniref:Uncharacterized protein n=1 Tax=Candidatus Bilamarchaeum dharawalense TaxID=2885759 RepID=A0A5E4LKG1_9ARCH|nr:Uncharacterised protein [Candidatus Bilamarchaeum dharawalense]